MGKIISLFRSEEQIKQKEDLLPFSTSPSQKQLDKKAKDEFAEIHRQSSAALLQKDPKRAYLILRDAISYPNLPVNSNNFRPAFALFSEISLLIAGEELSTYVKQVVDDTKNPKALYELGYQLIEYGLPQIAATVLARAHFLMPESTAILSELSASLEMSHLHEAAYEFLKQSSQLNQTDFICRYLFAFNALMTMRIAEAKQLVPSLKSFIGKLPDKKSDHEFMLNRITQMLVRADAVSAVSKLDGQDLRGWHFVVTGGLLLHISPHGFNEGMNGRYAMIQDSKELCLEAIKRLQAVFAHLEIVPPQVFLLADRDSAILAHAVAQEFQLPLVPWPKEGTEEPGLVVVYDLEGLDQNTCQQLAVHRPGQILFCHAVRFTKNYPLAADITTYFYQYNTAPWGERIVLAPDQKTTEIKPTLLDSPEEIAKMINASSVSEENLADLPTLLAFAQIASQLSDAGEAGFLPPAGRRCRQCTDSPVKSNQFT